MEHAAVFLAEDRIQTERLWPWLEIQRFDPVGGGWTCRTYEIDGQWIAQFPNSEYAARTLRKQLMALPLLSPRLPSRVPVPLAATAAEPLAMLYRRIDGKRVTDLADGDWPEQLGLLLRTLQATSPKTAGVPPATAAGLRTEARGSMADLASRVFPLLREEERDRLVGLFNAWLDDDRNWEFQPVLVHGDLGPEHILVSDSGDLAGVIDWEELRAGDPAADLAWALNEAPAAGARVMSQLIIDRDLNIEARARFLHLLMPFHEVTHGQETGRPDLIESGLTSLRLRLGRYQSGGPSIRGARKREKH